ncbi:hypothetical protein DSECCO2_428110 [anaerobic digester metagenome]
MLTHIVGNLPNGALPVFHILKPHHDVNNVRPGAAEEGEHAAFVVCTGRGGSNHHFRVALPDHLLHLAGGFHGLFHPGTGLQFNGHRKPRLVGLRHKVGTDKPCEHDGNHKNSQGAHHHEGFVVQGPAQGFFVEVVQSDKERLYQPFIAEASGFFRFLAQFQHTCRHHGGEGDGGHGGGNDGDGHDPSELVEHHTGQAAHQSKREEHGHHHQGGDDYRQPHFVGGVDRRFARTAAAFDVAGDVFEHHDGVVHHHPDGDGERGQRDHVHRIAGDKEVDKRDNERNRDGKDNDKGCAPAPEEDQHHQGHEDKRPHKRFGEVADGAFYKCGGVYNQVDLHIGGQGFLELFQVIADIPGHLNGVGARLFHGEHPEAGLSVDFLVDGDILERVAHGSHVAQVNRHPVGITHHQVAELAAVAEFALYAQLVVHLAHLHVARRHVEVFGGDDVADLLYGEVIGVEAFGVGIHVNDAFGGAHHGDGSHAVDAVQGVDDLLLQQLFKARVAFLRGDRVENDGHHIGVELEDNGAVGAVGQLVVEAVKHVAHLVGGLVEVCPPAEFNGDYRKVVRRGGSHLFYLIHRVERVLHLFGDVGLDIGRVCARVGGHHRKEGRVDLGIEVNGDSAERIQAHHDHGRKDHESGDGLVYRGFIYTHNSLSFRDLTTVIIFPPPLPSCRRAGGPVRSPPPGRLF